MLPLKMLEIRYYVANDSRQPFAEWVADLDALTRAKVVRAIKRMEQGNLSNAKTVGAGVLEFRIDYGPGYRLYFGRDGDTLIILLVGGTKNRQQRDSWLLARLQRQEAQEALTEIEMARSKPFDELVRQHVKSDKKFADALLCEGIDAMLEGDVEVGKSILRDYIKATVGFEKLGEATGAPPKSLIRMFGPRGNPQAKNLFTVIGYLQKRVGLRLHVASTKKAPAPLRPRTKAA